MAKVALEIHCRVFSRLIDCRKSLVVDSHNASLHPGELMATVEFPGIAIFLVTIGMTDDPWVATGRWVCNT